MSNYLRVIPRDLFNEANLLKCYGRLWIVLDETAGHGARFETDAVPSFEIEQDPSNGAIYVGNVRLSVYGTYCRLTRPLNSRRSWALYAEPEGDDAEPVDVFNEDGNLTADMLAFIHQNIQPGSNEQ